MTRPRARRRFRRKPVRQLVVTLGLSAVIFVSMVDELSSACDARSGSSESDEESSPALLGRPRCLLLLSTSLDRFMGPRGRTRKKLSNITIGNNEEAKRLDCTLRPNVVVAKEYAPAPTKPAPPVPLPQAARLKGP